MIKELTGYDLSRAWFDFCFENPDKICTNHTALYFFAIEHCNRLGWKKKFGLPTTMAMEAIGIKSYNTYKKTLAQLIEFGFIQMVEISKNQYSSNIIALSNFNKAPNKALDKALTKHMIKQSESTVQSTGESNSSINKQLTINNKPLTVEQQTTPLGLRLQNIFLQKNKKYPPRPGQDIPAIISIAEFLYEQQYGNHKNIFEMDVGEQDYVFADWEKVCDWYALNGGNNDLQYLEKFKLQKIYSEIKNGKHDLTKTNFNRGNSAGAIYGMEKGTGAHAAGL
jgi:hypothetical protein